MLAFPKSSSSYYNIIVQGAYAFKTIYCKVKLSVLTIQLIWDVWGLLCKPQTGLQSKPVYSVNLKQENSKQVYSVP